MPSRHAPIAVLALSLLACNSGGAGDTEVGGSSSSGDEGPTSTGDEASSSSSTGEPCPVGAEGCPCTGGGSCDEGLACEADVCVPGCTPGDKGCSCSEGGGCFAPWVCMAGTCEEGVSETCGDGQVDEFEECDEGKENSDASACTSSCKLAICGDGLVGPGETCDGGEGCTASCSLSSCGDGKLDEGEECEPASADDVECTQKCTDARKVIFVTSEMYKGGEIGGVAGGDAKCQALADKAGLPGVFFAWLATSKDDAPLVRFSWKEGVPYVDTAGDVLAENWHELAKPPALTEIGSPAGNSEIDCGQTMRSAWSVNIDGPRISDNTNYSCNGWSDTAAAGAASRFAGGELAPAMSVTCWAQQCALRAPIFCIEQ